MTRAAGSYVAWLPGVEKSLVIPSFRGPVGDNVVQDQRYAEYNHSVSPNEDFNVFLMERSQDGASLRSFAPSVPFWSP